VQEESHRGNDANMFGKTSTKRSTKVHRKPGRGANLAGKKGRVVGSREGKEEQGKVITE